MKEQPDITEFEQLFTGHYVALVRYCATIVKDIEDAEDIVQQIYTDFWQKKVALNIQTSARAYLYKSVYNASLDFLKHHKVKKVYQRLTLANSQEAAQTDTTIATELKQKIESAILKLPEQCGKIFRMCKMDNMKYREIATKLDISEKTVENQMGKALRILRAELQEYLPFLLILLNIL